MSDYDSLPSLQGQAQPEPERGYDHLPDLAPAPQAQAAPPQGPAVDPRPWYAKPLGGIGGQVVDDLSRLAMGGLTLGASDRLASMVNPGGFAAEQRETEAARGRQGLLGMATEFAGGMALPLGLASKGLTVSRAIPQAVNNLATRAIAGGVEGAGYAATSAALGGHDPLDAAKVGGVLGAAGAPVAELASRFVQGAAGASGRAPAVPTSQALKDTARQAYDAVDAAGVTLKPSFVSDLERNLTNTLANEAYSPRIHGGVRQVLEELTQNPGQNVTLRGMENVRRLASDLRTSSEPGEARLGGILTREIDKAFDGLNQSHVLSGNKTAGVQALQEARAAWSQARKTEMVEGLLQRAQDRSSGALGSLDNAIRVEARSLLKSPETKFLSGDERRALRQVIYGDTFGNTMSALATFAPQAGALRAIGTLGLTGLSGGTSVPLSVAGAVANPIAGKAAQNRVYGLARVIANQGMAPPQVQSAIQKLADPERELLASVLKGWGIPNLATSDAVQGKLLPQ